VKFETEPREPSSLAGSFQVIVERVRGHFPFRDLCDQM
jgi:hypothetical protein